MAANTAKSAKGFIGWIIDFRGKGRTYFNPAKIKLFFVVFIVFTTFVRHKC